jgi:hypothetical protein
LFDGVVFTGHSGLWREYIGKIKKMMRQSHPKNSLGRKGSWLKKKGRGVFFVVMPQKEGVPLILLEIILKIIAMSSQNQPMSGVKPAMSSQKRAMSSAKPAMSSQKHAM